MKNLFLFRILISILVLVSIAATENYAFGEVSSGGQNQQKSLIMVVLPFNTLGVDAIATHTAEEILRQELYDLGMTNIISREQTIELVKGNPCIEISCAVEIGKGLNADQVALCSLSSLGQKIYIQYMLVDVHTETTLISDSTSSTNVEDLEIVMKRVARSLFYKMSISKTAEVGIIMEKETEKSRRREAHKYYGISFGFLYPENGYEDNSDKSFTIDFRFGYDLDKLTVGSMFAARHGFATNIYASYLFTKNDVCPYLGGAFGYHWVAHDYYYDGGGGDEDGFEVTFNAGLRAFRTYNFQVLINLDYSLTINDYDDRALIFTIGLLR